MQVRVRVLATRQPSRGAGTARGSRELSCSAPREPHTPVRPRCGWLPSWRRAMTTDACTPSEADLRAEIAKLELELKGVTEKARLSQEALDSARSQEPTEPKKKPRRRGGKKKHKMSDAILEARQEVQRCPRNAQCRLDLARAYENEEKWREAYAEASAAKILIPTYGRAWRLKQKLEKMMGEKNIRYDDDDNLYLDTPLDAKVEDEDALPPVTASSPEEAREKAAEEKKQGDAHFLGKRHEQACERWGRAIDLLKAHGITDVSVAKLYSNRAAAHLALKKHVLAARDGALAVECDDKWWKGHWYFGQATLELVKASAAQRGACTSNGERAQEAYRAFVRCAGVCPASKKDEVELLAATTQQKIYEMTEQEGCVVC